MIYIFKIIQMIGIDIENDFYLRPEVQKAVHVFTGFRNEIFSLPYFDVASYLGQIASHQDGGVSLSVV